MLILWTDIKVFTVIWFDIFMVIKIYIVTYLHVVCIQLIKLNIMYFNVSACII